MKELIFYAELVASDSSSCHHKIISYGIICTFLITVLHLFPFPGPHLRKSGSPEIGGTLDTDVFFISVV